MKGIIRLSKDLIDTAQILQREVGILYSKIKDMPNSDERDNLLIQYAKLEEVTREHVACTDWLISVIEEKITIK